MNPPDLSAGQWKVAVHSHGEILTASSSEASIELGLLGIPAGYSPPEIEGWLHDLIGVARETGREDAQPRPIPALLHHGLTGLLFSHAQLWNREGEHHPASYAIVHEGGTVAFGWIGSASIVTHAGGTRVEPAEVIVRDDDGREARAFEFPASEALDIHLEWAPGENGGARVVLEAHWDPSPREAGASSVIPATDRAPSSPESPAAEVSPGPPAEVPSLLDEIESPAARQSMPDVIVKPMEDIERETFHAPSSAPAQSFLEPTGEPLDLSERTPAPAGPAGIPAPAAEFTREEADEPDLAHAPEAGAASREEPRAELEADPEPQPAGTPPLATALLDEEGLFDGAASPDAEAERGERPGRLRRMFARFAFWRRDEPAADPEADDLDSAISHDVPGVPEQVPPSPESMEVTERAVQDYVPIEHDADPYAEAEALARDAVESGFQGAEPDAAGIPAGISEVEAEAEPEPEPEVEPEVVSTAPAPHREATLSMEEPSIPPHEAKAQPQIAAPPAQASRPQVAPPWQTVVEPAPEPVQQPAATALTGSLIEPHVVEPGTPLVAAAADPVAVRTPLRPQWPTADQLKPPAPLWKRPWVWGVMMVALFAGGWIVGHMNDERREGASRGMRDVLRSVGLGGAHFDVMVNSRPPGAWISVDGEDLVRRTPASIELKPGEHEVTLSFSDLGAATFNVRGADGDRLALDPPLWGSISIYSSDADVPVAVTVDGVARGFAPLRADSLQPGAHDVRFSGPGLPSWGQTVQVRVGESSDLIARPMTSPATGVIEVRASITTATGAIDVEGAKVWLDSEPAGQTPLTLELPRGPHSLRVEHLGESAPVQVIDLPGGNQRFASFQLRPAADFPSLAPLDPPAAIPLDQPTVISTALDGIQSTDVREMWLHVQTPDGPWRRYQMAWLKAPDGVVGVAVFPTTMFGENGRAKYYTSASTQTGDEFYSEVRDVARPDAPRAGGKGR